MISQLEHKVPGPFLGLLPGQLGTSWGIQGHWDSPELDDHGGGSKERDSQVPDSPDSIRGAGEERDNDTTPKGLRQYLGGGGWHARGGGEAAQPCSPAWFSHVCVTPCVTARVHLCDNLTTLGYPCVSPVSMRFHSSLWLLAGVLLGLRPEGLGTRLCVRLSVTLCTCGPATVHALEEDLACEPTTVTSRLLWQTNLQM